MEPGLEIGRSSLPCLQLIGLISHSGQLSPARALVASSSVQPELRRLAYEFPPPFSSDVSPKSTCSQRSSCTVCQHSSSSLGKGLANFDEEAHSAANPGPKDPHNHPVPKVLKGCPRPEPPTSSPPTKSEGHFLRDLPGHQSASREPIPRRSGLLQAGGYLSLEALHQNGNKQVKEHIVAKGHEGNEVKGSPGRRGGHSVVEHLVPVLLGQDLQAEDGRQGFYQGHSTTPTHPALFPSHLKDGDDGPEQGVKILSVRQRVPVSLRCKFAAKEMHAQDAEDTGVTRWGQAPATLPLRPFSQLAPALT